MEKKKRIMAQMGCHQQKMSGNVPQIFYLVRKSDRVRKLGKEVSYFWQNAMSS